MINLQKMYIPKNKENSLENRPPWNSNTLKNKKNKVRENLKQEKIISANNIKNKVEQRKKKNMKFTKSSRCS